jgi:hypothetical protein
MPVTLVKAKWVDGNLVFGDAPGASGGRVDIGEDGAGMDRILRGATSGSYLQWDESADELILAGVASIQTAQTGTGYSLNLISVTSTTASGNTRGLRVNTTTSPSITHGDLQCVHGYLTMGAGVTLGTGAAIYPLSAWIDLPSDITTGSGNVIAGLRVIFDPNGVVTSAVWQAAASRRLYMLRHGRIRTARLSMASD